VAAPRSPGALREPLLARRGCAGIGGGGAAQWEDLGTRPRTEREGREREREGGTAEGRGGARGAGMDYIAHISVWNQLQSLAKQMQHDIVHAPNHKYIAHQLALLYVRALPPAVVAPHPHSWVGQTTDGYPMDARPGNHKEHPAARTHTPLRLGPSHARGGVWVFTSCTNWIR
jgi:hypothetical protein